MDILTPSGMLSFFTAIILAIVILGVFAGLLIGGGYALLLWRKHKEMH